jgi:CheY-like chemotaxis protein
MPDDTGIALGNCLRGDPRLAHCRLVALSGYSKELFGSRAADAFHDWIIKPIDVAALQLAISRSPLPR